MEVIYIALLIVVIIVLVLVFFMWKRSKKLLLPNITLITGGVKTGKTTLCVYLAIKKYKSQLFKWRLRHIFDKKLEKPLLYSNISLRFPHVPLTKELLLRQKRFAYGSVVIISEGALVADSQNYRDDYVNESLTLFCKLFGHETRGGYLFVDTQNIKDLHYAFKRSCNSFLWIHSNQKFPFLLKMNVREMYYSDESGVINTFNSDVDENTKVLWIFKSIWKKFDYVCYSIFTDYLPVVSDVVELKKSDSLKTDYILQIKDFKFLKGGLENAKSKDKTNV